MTLIILQKEITLAWNLHRFRLINPNRLIWFGYFELHIKINLKVKTFIKTDIYHSIFTTSPQYKNANIANVVAVSL